MSAENIPEDGDDALPQLQTETAGAGGGRKVKTAIGAGEGNDGGWYRPREMPSDPGRIEPVRHVHLKDMAIEELSSSEWRDYSVVCRRISGRFPEFGLAQEGLADALTRMVLSAFTVAQYVPDEHVFEELKWSCPYFSDQQLLRIIELSSRNKPMIR